MKTMMIRTVLALAFLLFSPGLTGYAHAQICGNVNGSGGGSCPAGVPEIDPSLAGTGIALVGGAVLLIRARRRH
jgi:hypothetical protein